jgi:epoxyqueuosine reductase
MLTKEEIIAKALRLGFADIGFAGAQPFDSQKQYLLTHQEQYGWIESENFSLLEGTDPANILPEAKTIIVLLESYFEKSLPLDMERHFGRWYHDDDRVTKTGLSRKVKAFRQFLTESNIDSQAPPHLPHKLSAARAGLGTFGNNCVFYAKRIARGSSFVLPIALIINVEYQPDEPTIEIGCPDWCRNACISACPTRALKGSAMLDPRRCISYLTYYGEGLTPRELREPMGMYVYGCDRCQNVCPRNTPWLTEAKPPNERVAVKAGDFELTRLLHMDIPYFEHKIRPHMFYMNASDLWRWKMNAARAMGNSLNPVYAADLIRAFKENTDERVKSMTAWALGRIGGAQAKAGLQLLQKESAGIVKEEIEEALGRSGA